MRFNNDPGSPASRYPVWGFPSERPLKEDPPTSELVDGYYYVFTASIDPESILPGDWISGPALHNGAAGDTSTGYRGGSQGASPAGMAVMARKTAQMGIDELDIMIGYANDMASGPIYGKNSIVDSWTLIDLGIASTGFSHFGAFSYISTEFGPGVASSLYGYIMVFLRDTSGANNEVGCSDIRFKNSGSDVGP